MDNAAKNPSLAEMEEEIRQAFKDRDRLMCAKCRATPENAVPLPCTECVTGMMRGRITELEGEFHLDWMMNRWVGRCGHRWIRLGPEKPEKCPVCALLERGRPKGLVRDVAELAFSG